ncbi:Trehalose transport system permease protein SugB [subsurface metagenome]
MPKLYKKNPISLPDPFTMENWVFVFSNNTAIRSIINSFSIMLLSVAISLIIGIIASYGIYRYKFKGKKSFLIGILIIRVLPPVVTIVPFFVLFKSINLTDTIWALILIYPAFLIPLVIWLIHGFFCDIPRSIEESARIDGCNWYQSLFKVMIPLSAPGLIAVAIIVAIAAWNEYILASILATKKAVTIPVVVSMQVTERAIYWGRGCALIIVLIVPIFILSVFIQKYMARGLTAGAIKE